MYGRRGGGWRGYGRRPLMRPYLWRPRPLFWGPPLFFYGLGGFVILLILLLVLFR